MKHVVWHRVFDSGKPCLHSFSIFMKIVLFLQNYRIYSADFMYFSSFYDVSKSENIWSCQSGEGWGLQHYHHCPTFMHG